MTLSRFSSGDAIADRRADYARMLAEGGDPAAAADLMRQALQITPAWTAGWRQLGDYSEKAGERAAAIAAYTRLAALDTEGVFAASLKLAALGAAAMPALPPSRYVEGLFDDYADRFETALVERLDYDVPRQLGALIAETKGRVGTFGCAVDLGCGTGLFGPHLRPLAARLEGFDLSMNMLSRARSKGVYDHLGRADLSQSAEACGLFADGLAAGRADLAAAADVMMYLGRLETVMPLAAALLAPGGLFAFSVEDAGESDIALLPSLRYAHGEAYLRQLLPAFGMDVVQTRHGVIRKDAGMAVAGILLVARKEGGARAS